MKAIATKQNIQLAEPKLQVFLQPCNEKQDLNYIETFVGTPAQIAKRSIQIIEGLSAVLTLGDFSVKIQSANFPQVVYLDNQNLFDADFNTIGNTNDFINSKF